MANTAKSERGGSAAAPKVVRSVDVQEYMREARSFEVSRIESAEQSRRTAWIVAGVATLAAMCAVLAVAMLSPLKAVQPYVIRVDNSTGIVDVVKELSNGRAMYDEVVNKYFAQLYVRYREGYSRSLAEEYYVNVGLMSVGTEQRRYHDWFNPKNPVSPLRVFGDTARVKVTIKSTSFIRPNVALVRYLKEVERGSEQPSRTHWAATLTFKYVSGPAGEKERAINPLGFLVEEYRNDPDADSIEPQRAAAPVGAVPSASAPAVVLFPGQQATTAPLVPAIQATQVLQ